jgi:hypothetical protein
MATPPITASTRYFDVGTTKIYFLPTIANTASVTRAEMNAGTDLSREVADIDGWSVSSNEIEVPDFATRFTAKIGGRIEASDSSLTFYSSQNSADVRSLLPRDTAGFILWLDGGDVPTQKMDVYPVKVRAVSKMRSAGSEAARIQVQFSVTREPTENSTIPA